MTIFSKVEVLGIPIPFTEKVHLPKDQETSPLLAVRRDREYQDSRLQMYNVEVLSLAHLMLTDTRGFRYLIAGPDINRNPIWIRREGIVRPSFLRRRLHWLSEYTT